MIIRRRELIQHSRNKGLPKGQYEPEDGFWMIPPDEYEKIRGLFGLGRTSINITTYCSQYDAITTGFLLVADRQTRVAYWNRSKDRWESRIIVEGSNLNPGRDVATTGDWITWKINSYDESLHDKLFDWLNSGSYHWGDVVEAGTTFMLKCCGINGFYWSSSGDTKQLLPLAVNNISYVGLYTPERHSYSSEKGVHFRPEFMISTDHYWGNPIFTYNYYVAPSTSDNRTYAGWHRISKNSWYNRHWTISQDITYQNQADFFYRNLRLMIPDNIDWNTSYIWDVFTCDEYGTLIGDYFGSVISKDPSAYTDGYYSYSTGRESNIGYKYIFRTDYADRTHIWGKYTIDNTGYYVVVETGPEEANVNNYFQKDGAQYITYSLSADSEGNIIGTPNGTVSPSQHYNGSLRFYNTNNGKYYRWDSGNWYIPFGTTYVTSPKRGTFIEEVTGDIIDQYPYDWVLGDYWYTKIIN